MTFSVQGVDLRHVHFLVLVFVEVAFNKLLKIPQAHLPCFILLDLHLVETAVAQFVPDMFFKSVVEERAAAKTTGTDGRFFYL